MKLSEEDAKLYWQLMWALLMFVNRRRKIIPDVDSAKAYVLLPHEEKTKIRNTLYANIDIIDAFVKENPDGFSEEELEIAAKWKDFVKDMFYIERYLKNHAIFISNSGVYAVKGISDGFDEMIPRNRLPYSVNAVLLPFKGKIIYDGVLPGYNIFFGGNLKKSLREDYMAAKQAGRIIETLAPDSESAQPKKAPPSKDWTPELESLMKIAKKLKGGADQHPINSPIFALIRAGIELGLSAAKDPEDIYDLYEFRNKTVRAINKVTTILERTERYK